jgi:serine/threonine protein kinase/formylglycine-generating enzyme required for sulfatase activity
MTDSPVRHHSPDHITPQPHNTPMTPNPNLHQLWTHSTTPPDLQLWLPAAIALPPHELLAELRFDQQRRWNTPHPFLAEDYLRLLQSPPPQLDWELELIVGEWLARLNTQPLSPDEIQHRFPQFTDLHPHLVPLQPESSPWTIIDHVCTRLEDLHQQNHIQPRLEYCLANLPPSIRYDGFTALLKAELECLATRSQSAPDTAQWESRFPQYTELIKKITPQSTRTLPAPPSPPTRTSQKQHPDNEQRLPIPAAIGKYKVTRELGRGAFGIVYLAKDPQLDIDVAVKIPHSPSAATTKNQSTPRMSIADYVREARIVARLTHPHIVPVMAAEYSSEFQYFVVTRFIPPGQTLAEKLKHKRFDYHASARLIATVADALQYAHESRIVHRDIKPANILIDDSGNPHVTDFGLAIHEQDFGINHRYAGTPGYMSPELVRGEGLDPDPREDIFSLGVVLYEMLTGRRPFTGNTISELFHKIGDVRFTPIPPREHDDRIPIRLEQICLKSLAKLRRDRYSSAAELADDLRAFLQPNPNANATQASPPAGTAPTTLGSPTAYPRITPRGLRHFVAEDAAFFLQLLPGLRNRDGLPQSVSWWKTLLNHRSTDRTTRLCVMYGPSGCGKSSLIRAGILPLLDSSVLHVCIDATSRHTEQDLLAAIRSRIPERFHADLPEESLTETLRQIRIGKWLPPGTKLLIVLDQFEQWLSSHNGEAATELESALRQCDGTRLKALVMVRDDFWMQITRFMELQEVQLVQARNAASVDLFDPPHARTVLAAFGSAYGRLPHNTRDFSSEQREFLKLAVEGLTEHGRVICIRLAVFADMFRGREWTPDALQKIGGITGVGTTFLDETFSSSLADVRCRRHQQAALHLLGHLLPTQGSELKLPRCSEDLLTVSGYKNRPDAFSDLIQILDSELRLITPVETADEHAAFQLTHDYLIPSVRAWREKRLPETATGRARLTLSRRAAAWSDRRESKQLPSVVEWFQINLLVPRYLRTAPQQAMLHAATESHLLRLGSILATTLLLVLTLRSVFASQSAKVFAESLRTVDPSQLTDRLEQADEIGARLDPLLQPSILQADASAQNSTLRRLALPARLVLVQRDSRQVPELVSEFLNPDLELAYLAPIRDRIRPHAHDLQPQLLKQLQQNMTAAEPAKQARAFRAALALAGLENGSPSTPWTDAELTFIATHLVSQFSEFQPELRDLLRPIASRLLPALNQLFDAESSTPDQQVNAALALANFAGNNSELLADLLVRANQRQTQILYPKLTALNSAHVRDSFSTLTRQQPDEKLGQLHRVQLGRRRANAAITLLRHGAHDASLAALRTTDDPESLSQFVARCRSWGVTPLELLECIKHSLTLRNSQTAAAAKVESRVLYGLLLALGSYPANQLPNETRAELIAEVTKLYEQDSNAAVHSASAWLLRTWGEAATVDALDQTEVPYDATGQRDWFRWIVEVTPHDVREPEDRIDTLPKRRFALTFVVFPAGQYQLGSLADPDAEPVRGADEPQRIVQTTQPVALCDREVPWALYEAFQGTALRQQVVTQFGWDVQPTDPVIGATWFEWISFCRWLTAARFGDAEQFQCYSNPDSWAKNEDGVTIPPHPRLQHPGFRMPTDSEWELGARSGQKTTWAFGSDSSLFGDYAWFKENSGKRPRASGVKQPTIGGLFDTHGNCFEWTWDRHDKLNADTVLIDPLGPDTGENRVIRGGSWDHDPDDGRLAYRLAYFPTGQSADNTLRLALTPPPQPAAAQPAK